MKVYGIAIADRANDGRILAAAFDLTSFNYFQRSSIQEFMNFFIKTITERTQPGQRQRVEEQETYVGYVYTRTDSLTGVIITDSEYQQRAAFSILSKVLEEFSSRYGRSQWATLTPAMAEKGYPELKEHLVKFQDPHAADPLLRVQRDLDETKVVLHKTMESLLNRGEKLDDLVQRSDQLSSMSKSFYTSAKKTNSCCG
ncbi:snare Ykt6 [Zopfochytrium polystomum]|nr:snare Ykt6 [Zopfochytrium polystomum]